MYTIQGNIASGSVVEFEINPELIGLIIGKKGARIKEVEEKTGTKIRISTPKNPNERHHVSISGNDNVSVRKARELMEVSQESHPVDDDYMQVFLRDKRRGDFPGDLFGDLRETSGLLQIFLDVPNKSIVFRGTKTTLKSGSILLAQFLENIRELNHLEFRQREAYAQLSEVRAKINGVDRSDGSRRNFGRGEYDRDRNQRSGNGYAGRQVEFRSNTAEGNDRNRSSNPSHQSSVSATNPVAVPQKSNVARNVHVENNSQKPSTAPTPAAAPAVTEGGEAKKNKQVSRTAVAKPRSNNNAEKSETSNEKPAASPVATPAAAPAVTEGGEAKKNKPVKAKSNVSHNVVEKSETSNEKPAASPVATPAPTPATSNDKIVNGAEAQPKRAPRKENAK